ncbi:MAG: N-acetylglucosamine-6-phosphate deacetylase [Chloroflexota bacterium]|nr:N-acetylglucosamine-6-phosphate deacetylase [Chloroflexota bacterium]
MRYTLRGARLVDASGERRADIAVEGGSILRVGADVGDAGEAVVEAPPETLVTPGFVDVHTHGGGGFDLHTTDPEEIRSYARWAPSSGTTAFLVGVVGVPGAIPEAQLRAAAEAIEHPGPGAEAVGIHLEGPYISPQRRGAHLPEWLRLPNEGETERILELAAGRLRLVTLAPELPGGHQMTRRLVEAGVTVSIGHTDATYEQAREAIALGITHATHCFNAMRPLHHREPGALGAIVEADSVRGELIGDGVHVHPAAMRLLTGALGAERTVVVTDALSAAGQEEGAGFTFAGQEARVVDGVARLSDGTITGSVLTMERALRNLVNIVGVRLPDAVGMLSRNPARSAGAAHRKGLLQPGYDADLLLFGPGLMLQATICRGRLAWATDDFRTLLDGLPLAT